MIQEEIDQIYDSLTEIEKRIFLIEKEDDSENRFHLALEAVHIYQTISILLFKEIKKNFLDKRDRTKTKFVELLHLANLNKEN